jgi:Trk K+ transport system NAD-binding subunit
VLVSIQRGEEIIIPRGDTILRVGDVVTTLCERDTIATLKHMLLSEDGKTGTRI